MTVKVLAVAIGLSLPSFQRRQAPRISINKGLTVAMTRNALILFFGVERGLLAVNPAARIRHEREPNIVRRRFFSPEEREGMLSRLEFDTEAHGLVLAAFSTGMRPRELAAFRFEWIDWSRETVEVPNTVEFSPKSH